MKDKLEKYIKENREEFDFYEPGNEVWQNINKKLDSEKSTESKFPLFWKIAASAALLIAAIFVAQNFYKKTPVTVAQASVYEIAPELKEVEAYYTSVIREKRKEVLTYSAYDKGLFLEADQGLKNLDSIYLNLKNELVENRNKDKVIDAMVRNLQIRIEILNQQLMTLKKVKKLKNNKDENSTI